MDRPTLSLKFWSLVCVGACVVGVGDLLSVGIGSCSNRSVTYVDKTLVIGSALVFVVSAIAVLVGVVMKLASIVQRRANAEPKE